MPRATEAFARAKVDALLRDASWKLSDGISVHFEYTLSDGARADYVLAHVLADQLAEQFC